MPFFFGGRFTLTIEYQDMFCCTICCIFLTSSKWQIIKNNEGGTLNTNRDLLSFRQKKLKPQ